MWHTDFSIYDLKITGKFDIPGVISNTMPTIPRGLDEKEKDNRVNSPRELRAAILNPLGGKD